MFNVAFVRKEIARLLPQYYLIRDCIAGETVVKDAGVKYLPMPDASDKSPDNKARYISYLTRAVFFNASRRTLHGLVGQVFMRDPVVKVPAGLDAVVENADGGGVSLIQQSKKSLSLTLAYSRSGVFVDYPTTGGDTTAEQRDNGEVRPIITTYSPMEIVNYRTATRGAIEYLSMVMLAESYPSSDDGFELKTSCQFRQLLIDDNGNYVQKVWREKYPTEFDGTKLPKRGQEFELYDEVSVTGPDGQPLKDIPFMFIGSENNDPNPDNPNFYDLCSVNIAHYRNSADYEQICYIVGQPTPVVMGVDKSWIDEMWKGRLNFGASGGIVLPNTQYADAKLLEVTPNTMAFEAMGHKEQLMIALGAKLVETKAVQKTAYETKVEATSEGSVLSSTTKNVTSAYLWALKLAAKLANLPEDGIEFELNTDFDIARMTPEEVKQTIDTWQKGAITFNEMRTVLRKAGQATEDDTAAKASIAKDTAEAMALAMPDNQPGAAAFNPANKPAASKTPQQGNTK